MLMNTETTGVTDATLNRQEAAALARVHPRTISRWMRDGHLSFERDLMTGRPMFSPDAVRGAVASIGAVVAAANERRSVTLAEANRQRRIERQQRLSGKDPEED